MDYNKIALEKCIKKNNYPSNWGWVEITSYENKRWLRAAYDIQKWWKQMKNKSKFVNKFKYVVMSQRNNKM
tara:strand:+ start:1898 stop:2110 length:213 start_codon:yes stop_codon:yes gene_type:complete